MTKLISGRVKKIPSANVSASRYEFIRLGETEPDLGLPAANGYILTANVDGRRAWILPTANLSAISINALADVDTVTLAPGLGFGLVWNGTNWVPNVITVSSTELSNVANTVLGIVQSSLVANTAFFAANANFANIALRSNVATLADSANTALFATNSTTANTVLSIGNFTTSNLAEGSNLYYTNTRVYSNIIAALPTYTGNINAGNIIANAIISGSGGGGSVTGANLISTNNISSVNWIGLYTANVIETAGNLYFTNARVFANVSPLLDRKANVADLTTANVAELNNLYYTNARVVSNVIAYLAANPVTASYGNANVAAFLTTYTGNISAGNVIANTIITGTGSGGSFTGANLISAGNISATTWLNLYTANVIESGNNLFYTNARVFANVSPLLDRKANIADLTTANVAELNNLYYTNARVASNVIVLLPTLAGDNISIAANGRISANLSAVSVNNVVGNLNVTGNIIANSFVSPTATSGTLTSTGNLNIIAAGAVNINSTNVIATGNLIANTFISTGPGSGLISSTGNVTVSATGIVTLSGTNGVVISGPLTANITTANVTELNNLYYTNSRVRSALSGGTGVAVDSASGVISIGQNVSTTSNVTFGALNVNGPINFYGNVTTYSSNNLSISDNMIYLNNGSQSSNPDLGISFNYNDGVYHHAGFFRDASDGRFKVFDNYDPEPDANIFINTDHASFRLANLSATTLFGNVQGTVSTLSNFTTSNLTEGTNKYFSNALARGAISAGDSTITYDPATGTIRATANVTAVIENTVNNLSTANVTESAGNLYYTNARVYSNVIALLPTYTGNISAGNINAGTITANTIIGAGSGGSVTGANLISTNNISSVNWLGLYTANVIETSGNLYFTNARVVSALSAGSGIAISGNGQISSTSTLNASSVVGLNTANVNEFGGNLYYSNARVLSNVIAFLAANPQGSQFANANVASFLSTYTGNISAGNVIANNFISTAPGTGTLSSTGDFNIVSGGNIRLTGNVFANTFISTATGTGSLTSTSDFNLIAAGNISLNAPNVLANGTIVANRITANLWSGIYTANVIESASNLYFTNARVQSNVVGFLPSLAGDNITIAANGRISATATTTVNAANVVGLTTANISEVTNLYYTNARVASNVLTLLPTLAGDNITIAANGRISANLLNVSVNSVTGNLNVTGNVIANGFVSASASAGLITSSGNITMTAAGAVNINSTNVIASGNVLANNFIATGSGPAILSSTGNVSISASGIVTLSGSSIVINGPLTANSYSGIFTANVTESASNLYFTNARVVSALSAGSGIAIAANGQISSTATLTATSISGLNTANVSESASNLYYTNARVLSNVTAYLAANPVTASYGNANVGAYLTTYTGNISAGNVIANAIISGTGLGGSITGANLISANNISASVITANTIIGGGSGGSITGANLISTNNISAVNWTGLYTSNVLETSGNLYFTNARVQSNVIGLLPSLAGDNITIAANGRISATVSATVNVSSIVGLTTANVTESNNNLYYTNARVLSNVTAYLAANPVTASYGNANVGAYLTTYTGNINAGNVIANNFISTAPGTGTLSATGDFNIVSSGNIRLTGNVYANTFISTATGSGSITSTSDFNINAASNVNVTASNINLNSNNIVTAGNVTVGRITATTWQNLYTANVIESGSSIFYTNARVYSNILAALPTYTGNIAAGNLVLTGGITDSTGVLTITTTGNSNIELVAAGNGRIVIDGMAFPATDGTSGQSLTTTGTGNLYWSSPAPSFSNANVGAYLTTYTGNISAGNINANAIVAGTGLGGSITGANLISANNISASVIFANTIVGGGSGGSITGANLITTNTISAVNWTGLYTANVIETSGNLYFTNARVVSALSAGSGIAISANGQISSTTTLTATAVTGLNTANVNEFGSNLYYTNARVLSNVTAYLAANPQGGTFGNANVGAYLTTYTGNINAGNVIANSFVAAATGTGTLTATGDFNIVSGGNIRLTGNVYSNTFISTATGAGSITSTSDFNINAASNVNVTASNINLNANSIITSGNITVGNLVLTGGITDTTGVLAISTTGGTNANIELTANGTGRIILDGQAWPLTDGVNGYVLQTNGTGNLFWAAPATSSFGNANVGAYLTTYTGNISAGNVIANTLITGSGSGGSFTGANLISAGNISATTWLNLYTANVIESGSSIFYTNTRVYSNVIALLPTLAGNNISIDANGRISANVSATVFATSIIGLTTANVAEVGSNLYFTNTRVVSALTAGEGITLAANGLISGGVHAITDSQTFAGGNANITLGTSVSLARRIIVTIDGLVQIPTTDYTVSGTILTLIPTPSPNSTIEVKFFGNEAITTQTFNPFLLAGL